MTFFTCKLEVSMGSKLCIVILKIKDNRTNIVSCSIYCCFLFVIVVFTWRESGVIKTNLKAQHVNRRAS